MHKDYIISYAQNREDIILASFFAKKDDGFYVDIGANDPEQDSVTKHFYDMGWSGINVEPIKEKYIKLKTARPRDININAGIGEATRIESFRQYDLDGLSTFDKARMGELKTDNLNYVDVKIPIKTLNDIFIEYNVNHIDFMKIDVEGYEFSVIKGNDWKKYRPKVLCIESNHVHEDWQEYITGVGYVNVFNDGLNDYFIDDKAKNKPEFKYVEFVIGQKIVPSFMLNTINEVQELDINLKSALKQVGSLELENQIIREKIIPLTYENEELREKLKQQKRLRNQVKGVLSSVDNVMQLNINKLNNAHIPETSDDLMHKYSNLTEQEVRLKISAIDKNRYYDSKHGITIKDRTAFIVVNGVYSFIKKIVKTVLVFFWKLLKKLRIILR